MNMERVIQSRLNGEVRMRFEAHIIVFAQHFGTLSALIPLGVILGETLTLPCDLEAPLDSFWQWCAWTNTNSSQKLKFTQGSSGQMEGRFSGILGDRQCNLKIADSTVEDSGLWRCHMATTEGIAIPVHWNKEILLRVIEPIELHFETSLTDLVLENDTIDIQCGPETPDPLDEFTLFLENPEEERKLLKSSVGATLDLTLNVTRDVEGFRLVCQVFKDYGAPEILDESQTGPIRVKIPLIPIFDPATTTRETIELNGTSFSTQAIVESRPPPNPLQVSFIISDPLDRQKHHVIHPGQATEEFNALPMVQHGDSSDQYLAQLEILNVSANVLVQMNIFSEDAEVLYSKSYDIIVFTPEPEGEILENPSLEQYLPEVLAAQFPWEILAIAIAIIAIIFIMILCIFCCCYQKRKRQLRKKTEALEAERGIYEMWEKYANPGVVGVQEKGLVEGSKPTNSIITESYQRGPCAPPNSDDSNDSLLPYIGEDFVDSSIPKQRVTLPGRSNGALQIPIAHQSHSSHVLGPESPLSPQDTSSNSLVFTGPTSIPVSAAALTSFKSSASFNGHQMEKLHFHRTLNREKEFCPDLRSRAQSPHIQNDRDQI